jgi:hypothetical protein
VEEEEEDEEVRRMRLRRSWRVDDRRGLILE